MPRLEEPGAVAPPVVNVYNSPCHLKNSVMQDKASQTDENPHSQTATTRNTSSGDDVSTDTELILTCTICNKALESSEQLDNHIDSIHANPPPSSNTTAAAALSAPPPSSTASATPTSTQPVVSPQSSTPEAHPSVSNPAVENGYDCDFCNEQFSSPKIHEEHNSDKHATAYLQCESCMLRFKNSRQLENHRKASHGQTSETPLKTKTNLTSSTQSPGEPKSSNL